MSVTQMVEVSDVIYRTQSYIYAFSHSPKEIGIIGEGDNVDAWCRLTLDVTRPPPILTVKALIHD